MKKPKQKADEWLTAKEAVRKINKHADLLDLSVNQLLMKAGVYSNTYYRWESGKSSIARAEVVNRILAVEA